MSHSATFDLIWVCSVCPCDNTKSPVLAPVVVSYMYILNIHTQFTRGIRCLDFGTSITVFPFQTMYVQAVKPSSKGAVESA